MVKILVDTNEISVTELANRPCAKSLTLDDTLPILASPDSHKALRFQDGTKVLTDGVHSYPDRDDVQILLPERLHKYFTNRLGLPLDHYANDAFLQYFMLSTIKQQGEINAPSNDLHYQRHLYRFQKLLNGATGRILDIGCDDPNIGASLLPSSAQYVGLDPFCSLPTPFRLIGVGEYLPFTQDAMDGVLFNTSLDHILDWHRAIDEARRVLKPEGILYLSSLVWTHDAELMRDSVHFHHFREIDLLNALSDFEIVSEQRYTYKDDDHRYGIYLAAKKPTNLSPIKAILKCAD